jgi:hypothetical protein
MLNREEVTQDPVPVSERRRQPRVERPAPVKVCMEHADGRAEFQAVLVNTSSTGLAIRHWRKELSVGQNIRVTGDLLGDIVARVVWNWTVGPLVISGLQKLENRSILLVDRCSPAGLTTHSAPAKSRSWLWAALTGLLIVVIWFVGSRS